MEKSKPFEHFRNALEAYRYHLKSERRASEFRESGNRQWEIDSLRNIISTHSEAHNELVKHITQVIDPLTDKPVVPELASIIAIHTLHDAEEMGFEEAYDHNFEWFAEREGLPVEAESRLLNGDESGFRYLAAYLNRKGYPLEDKLNISRGIMEKIKETGNLLEAIKKLSGKQHLTKSK